ncbi:hypothetical protein LJR118_000579 [Acidovorax sp. LjRoot118]|uniref:hypothetical protein n=1 Tax=Acidovorax sp. LjRoot118 TaxID=3342256 RepID=UPI003ED133DB
MTTYINTRATARAIGIPHGEPYKCPELRPIAGRITTRTTALPSRRGNRLHHPCGLVTDLAGLPITPAPEITP